MKIFKTIYLNIVQIKPEIFYQDNEFKIKTLKKMPVFVIFVPLTTPKV